MQNEDRNALETYFNEINSIPVLSHEEQRELAIKAANGDALAKNSLVEANLRFVVKIAKQFQNRGIELEDLICEGNAGLMTAADKFDPECGTHFISYAVWWIRQSIMKAIDDKSRLIKLPANKAADLLKMNRAQAQMLANDEEVTDESLSVASGLTLETVKLLRQATAPVTSLDVTINDDDNTTIENLIASNDDPEAEAMQNFMKESVRKAVASLPERERLVIIKRYGLDGEEPMSLQEVGTEIGLTKERIRQIEKKALETLRDEKYGLEAYIA